MEKISFHLEAFDGPLDLLLHLISKNKINIYDIPIADILEQYMQYMDDMQASNIELTSDFTAMAAHLLYIKSKMLLPVYKEDEAEEDPRAKLVEALLEYQRIKSVSPYLGKRGELGRDIFVKQPEPLEPIKEYIYNYNAEELIRALANMKERSGRKIPPPISSFSGIIGHEVASVNEQIDKIFKELCQNAQMSFLKFLHNARSRSELVASFLAVLELLKDERISVSEQSDGEYILLLAEVNS